MLVQKKQQMMPPPGGETFHGGAFPPGQEPDPSPQAGLEALRRQMNVQMMGNGGETRPDATAVAPVPTMSNNAPAAMKDMVEMLAGPYPGAYKGKAMIEGRPLDPFVPRGADPLTDVLPLTDVKVGGDEEVPSNLNILSREAAQRQVGKMIGQQNAPPPPFRDEQLRRLGMSDMEIRLMQRMGGLK
jgi:hypothetical protein